MHTTRRRAIVLYLTSVAAFAAAPLVGWMIRTHMGNTQSQEHPSALDAYTDWLFPIFAGAVVLAVWAQWVINMQGTKPRVLKYLAYLTRVIAWVAIIPCAVLLALITTDNPLIWG